MNAAAASQLNRAIAHGAEKGTFVLPKGLSLYPQFNNLFNMIPLGPSGKVKLAVKDSDAAKEVCRIFAENIIG